MPVYPRSARFVRAGPGLCGSLWKHNTAARGRGPAKSGIHPSQISSQCDVKECEQLSVMVSRGGLIMDVFALQDQRFHKGR